MSDIICPICEQKTNTVKATVINGQFMSERCQKCANTFIPPNAGAAKWKRDRMRENHRADMVQRYEGDKPSKEFARLYPERARQQFGDKFMETI